MNRDPIDLTIVIACYNEASHLEGSVREIERTLGATRYRWEAIFIDDGSRDGTQEIIRRLVQGREDRRAVFHETNAGRGSTVSEGIRMARGDVAGFLDIDLEVHCRYVPSLVSAILDDGLDVATAHRVYKISATPVGVLRWILSAGYRSMARLVLNSPYRDTETGYKFFRRERILPVLDRCRDRRWFWDTEVMLESRRAGLKVVEIPALFVRQTGKPTSLRLLPDTIEYMRAVSRYRKRIAAEQGGDDG